MNRRITIRWNPYSEPLLARMIRARIRFHAGSSPANCSTAKGEFKMIITQTQVNRIVAICEAGTQAHGDEFYEQILDVMDNLLLEDCERPQKPNSLDTDENIGSCVPGRNVPPGQPA